MYDAKYAEEVFALVKSHEQAFRNFMQSQRDQSPPVGGSYAKPNDLQFCAWFEMKTAENPNWTLALPYVDGGMAVLRKYERLRGFR